MLFEFLKFWRVLTKNSLNVELVFIILETITKFASKGKNSKVIDREGKNVIAYERIDLSKDKEKIDL